MANSIQRGGIFFVLLDPVVGSEMGYKERPVVVLSINDIHRPTGIATVVPGTTTPPKSNFVNVVRVDPDESNNLARVTYFQCHQIRAIDQTRMTTPPVGWLAERDFREIEKATWRVL